MTVFFVFTGVYGVGPLLYGRRRGIRSIGLVRRAGGWRIAIGGVRRAPCPTARRPMDDDDGTTPAPIRSCTGGTRGSGAHSSNKDIY